MRPHAALLMCLALLALAARAHAAGATYRFDPVHSQITFFVDHDGYSDVSGRLHIARGWFRFDPGDWSTARVVADIDLDGVDMGDKSWNRVVAGSDFLDAKAHPWARFVSGEVERTGADTGMLFGQLSLRGHTIGIAFPFRFNRRAFTIYGLHTVAGFTGLATLDRKDFGMDAYPRAVGVKVKVLLEIEGIEDSGAEQAYVRQIARETAHADQK